MAGKKRQDAQDPEPDDELNDDSSDDDDDDEELDAIARRAARTVQDADDEDDEDVSDEEVRQWLDQVVQTPEIQRVIRKASREIASKAVDRSVSEVRAELEKDFEARLATIQKQVDRGSITEEEADEKARKAAEATARKHGVPQDSEETDKKPDADSEKSAEEKRRLEERERRLQRREVEAYRREALAEEGVDNLIPEMVVVRDGTTTDDVDDMIEASRDAYSKLRKKVIRELREKGWQSPKALRKNSTANVDEEDDTGGDEEDTAPPSRDTRTVGMTKKRREELRKRFGYNREGRRAS